MKRRAARAAATLTALLLFAVCGFTVSAESTTPTDGSAEAPSVSDSPVPGNTTGTGDPAATEVTTEPTTTTTTTGWYEGDTALEDPEEGSLAKSLGSWGINEAAKFFKSNGTFLWLDTGAVVKALRPIFLAVGLLIALISWATSFKRTGQGSFHDRTSLIRSGFPLFMSLVGLVVSYAFMELILALCGLISSVIMGSTDVLVTKQIEAYSASISAYKNDTPLMGGFYQIISYLRASWPVLVVNLFFYIDSILIGVVLGMREVKLALYTGTAPAFLATLNGGDGMRSVGRNFIMTYLRTAIQLPLMAAVFGIFQIGFTGYCIHTELVESTIGSAVAIVLLAVLGFCIIKCDKWFEKILS